MIGRSSTKSPPLKKGRWLRAVRPAPVAGALGAVRCSASLFSLVGGNMDIEALKHRLRCLGWKVRELGAQDNGQWALLATSCGHTILAFANTRNNAWSAACLAAMRLTLTGVRPGPNYYADSSPGGMSGDGRRLQRGKTMIDLTEMRRLKDEYKRLKDRANRLFREWDEIDQRMVEIENVLPEESKSPSDSEKGSPS